MRLVCTFDCGLVTAIAVCQKPRYAANGRYTHACQLVDLTVGQALLQVFNDLPTIDECLELGRSAKVLEEVAAFNGRLEADDCLEKGVLCLGLLALCVGSIRFHGCINVLTR